MQPEVIRMDAFYDGATIRVAGTIGDGAQAVVAVSGPECGDQFNLKGRMGPIWLNSGTVRVSGVPTVLLVFGSGPLRSLLTPGVIASQGLDEDSLRQRVRLEPRQAGRDAEIRAGFLRLRHKDGVYLFANAGVRTGEPGKGSTPFSLEFAWPRRAPPATYEIRVMEVRGGQVAAEGALPLAVVRAGFPAWMAEFAETHAGWYGVVAVLLSVLAGFGIDFLVTRTAGKKRSVAH